MQHAKSSGQAHNECTLLPLCFRHFYLIARDFDYWTATISTELVHIPPLTAVLSVASLPGVGSRKMIASGGSKLGAFLIIDIGEHVSN